MQLLHNSLLSSKGHNCFENMWVDGSQSILIINRNKLELFCCFSFKLSFFPLDFIRFLMKSFKYQFLVWQKFQYSRCTETEADFMKKGGGAWCLGSNCTFYYNLNCMHVCFTVCWSAVVPKSDCTNMFGMDRSLIRFTGHIFIFVISK